MFKQATWEKSILFEENPSKAAHESYRGGFDPESPKPDVPL